jgi:uncharacterized YkwD family protein
MKKLFSTLIVLFVLLFPLHDVGTQVAGVFTTTSAKQVQVTASSISLRSGASSSHSRLSTLSKGTVVDVIGKIGQWYVVKTTKDTVGCVDSKYVKPYTAPVAGTTPAPTPSPSPSPQPAPTPAANSAAMQTEMLGYINAERAKENLAPLVLDKALSDGAYLKSKDMDQNGYFDHNSPTYGSPFDMMKSLGITYHYAGENIAKHTSVKGAHDAFMNSPGHRANIMKAEYTKIGLGFVQDGPYIYITQWFTD